NTDEPLLSIHPDDLAELGLEDGAAVTVVNATGSVDTVVEADRQMLRGVVSLPQGFARANVNQLVDAHAAVDHLSGMPLMSGVPVRIVRGMIDPADKGRYSSLQVPPRILRASSGLTASTTAFTDCHSYPRTLSGCG